MGMNLGDVNYYNETLLFTDVMKTASERIAYTIGGSDWNTQVLDSIPVDSNGWPLQIPHTVGGNPTGIRILFNNKYSGEYRVTWDGEGAIDWRGLPHEIRDGVQYVTLNGVGGHVWMDISASVLGNHIRNMKIIPSSYAEGEAYPVFNELYVRGLQSFKAMRYMNLMRINGSSVVDWADRTTKTYFTQGSKGGVAIEYLIELANTVQKDPWFCVPHKADDNYIRKFAELVKNQLDPGLTVYIEYSNEIWNWAFTQSQYVLQSAPGAEPHVTAALDSVEAHYCPNGGGCFPEKDAYMMGRTFKIWEDVWSSDRSKLVTVAGVQASWYANTGRVLKSLIEDDGVGADAVSPTAYFNFNEGLHDIWNAMDPTSVTPEMILHSVDSLYAQSTGLWVEKHQEYADQYGLDYLVYEGGQHMQPWRQGEYGYNQSVWDAQVHPLMYDLYMKNLQKHVDAGVDLFMAFSYVGGRESKYGSWGHLEYLEQINEGNLKATAPKYQALLDAAYLTIGGTPPTWSSSLEPLSSSAQSSEIEMSSSSAGVAQSSSLHSSSQSVGEVSEIDSLGIFYVGHSLISYVLPKYVYAVSGQAGKSQVFDQQIINGSSLKWNWEHDEGYGAALEGGGNTHLVITEALPLQNHLTWSGTYEYAFKFDSLAKVGNSGVQTYMFETWHCIYSGVEGGCPDDVSSLSWTERITDDLPKWEEIVDSVNAKAPHNPMVLIPGGQAMAALYDSIQLGVIPGRATIDEFFSDDIHPTKEGHYFMSLLYFAVLHKQNPVGISGDIFNEWGGVDFEPNQLVAGKLQEIAWKVACEYPPLGIECSGALSSSDASGETSSLSGEGVSSLSDEDVSSLSDEGVSSLSNEDLSSLENKEVSSSAGEGVSSGVPDSSSSESPVFDEPIAPISFLELQEKFSYNNVSGVIIYSASGSAVYVLQNAISMIAPGIYFVAFEGVYFRYSVIK